MRVRQAAFLGITLAVLAGCAVTRPGGAPPVGNRLDLPPFSIAVPPEPWQEMGRTDEGVYYSKTTEKGRDHTLMAFALADPLPRQVSSLADLEALVGHLVEGEYRPPRFHPQKIDIATEPKLAGGAVRVSFAIEDHMVPYAPGEVYVMVGHTLYTVHEKKALLVRYGYSQRFLSHDRPLPIDRELARFMTGLRLRND